MTPDMTPTPEQLAFPGWERLINPIRLPDWWPLVVEQPAPRGPPLLGEPEIVQCAWCGAAKSISGVPVIVTGLVPAVGEPPRSHTICRPCRNRILLQRQEKGSTYNETTKEQRECTLGAQGACRHYRRDDCPFGLKAKDPANKHRSDATAQATMDTDNQ